MVFQFDIGLVINGTGYVANQNQVFINCVGQNQIVCSQRGGSPCSIESESATNISVSFDTSTSDRSCEVAVSSHGSNSALYRNLSIPRFGAPPPPPPVINNPVIASIQAAGTIKSERMTYLTFWGSHFGGVGQNTIAASCGGSYTCTNSGSDCRITSESSGQINLRLPASPSSRSCSFTVKSNGLDSQSAQFSVEAFTVKTEMLKASGQNMRNWYQWNWYYNQVTGSEAPSVEVEDPAEDVSLDLWCASAQGNCDKMP